MVVMRGMADARPLLSAKKNVNVVGEVKMNQSLRLLPLLLLVALIAGCSTVMDLPLGQSAVMPAPVARPSAVFAPVGDFEQEMLKTVSDKQESLLDSCEQTESCDEVHFTRGLLGLFADRNVAAASFRRTLEISPNGPFAISSTRWLELLSGGSSFTSSAPGPETVMHNATEGLVRSWLRQKYLACKAETNDKAVSLSKGQPKDQPSVVALKRRINERERRIAELMAQLEALRTIELTRGDNKALSRTR
jgi:hypothetical protein